MPQPTIRHFHVKINKSFVHLVQYGHNEDIIKSLRSHEPVSSKSVSPSKQKAPNHSSPSRLVSSNNIPKATDSRSSKSSNPSDNLTSNDKINKLVIFIPGNPGVLGVYHDFLAALHATLCGTSDGASEQSVILAMGHNNFDHPDCCDDLSGETICVEDGEIDSFEQTEINDNREPHQVEMQVVNKLFILKRLLKISLKQADCDGCKLVFVGHSIGCYIILKLLQDKAMAEAHSGSILVHPALENLALTEEGAKLVKKFALKLDLLYKVVAYIIEKVTPKSVRLAITKWYFPREFVDSSSDTVIGSIAQLVNSVTMNALISMAKSELVSVKDLNHDQMIRPHVNKLKLIYTSDDQWVNDDHRLELSQSYPDLYIEEQQTLHAFIMDPEVVRDYAIKIALFIREYFEPK